MNASHRLSLALPLALTLLAGCSQRGTLNAPDGPAGAGTGTDQAEVAAVLAANSAYVDDEVSESAEATSLGTAASGAEGAGALGAQAAIRPLTFWREIRHVERRFEFAFADSDAAGRPTTAVVTIHKLFGGRFNILVGEDVPEGSPPQGRIIHKPLADHWVRRVLLRRVALPDSDRRVWRVVATSGVTITSREATTRIESLRVQSAGLDTTITDPLAFFRLRSVLKLDPLAEVILTATTRRSDDVLLLHLRDRRHRFHNNGDNTYTARFPVPDRRGLHHVGVNALSNGTLFDDEAPYDSQSWVEPYVVHPLELAEGTPLD